jgi:hypothetical protein
MHCADWYAGAGPAIDKARIARLPRHFFQRILARCVPLKKLRHDGRNVRVGGDDFLAIRARHVAIAERRFRWPDALLGLLLHSLARFLRQIIDVVFRHQHLDAVHELFRRARLPRQHDALLGEVNFDLQFVDRHPIFEVSVEPVGLLDQHYADRRMRLKVGDHLAESGAAGLLGGLHVHVFLRHREALRRRIFLKELQLRRDREALLLLLLRGDAGVGQRLLAGRLPGWPQLLMFWPYCLL